MSNEKLGWKVHTTELFKEILNNPECSSLYHPLNILHNLLGQVAVRAIELNDPKLNALMIRLTLYSIATPNDPEYDPVKAQKYIDEVSMNE